MSVILQKKNRQRHNPPPAQLPLITPNARPPKNYFPISAGVQIGA